jgi:hypothetical protein
MTNVPSTSTKELQFSGWSTSNFIKLTDRVTSYNNGSKAIAVGTRAAVQSILPTNTSYYRIEIDSPYVKLGYVQNFFGVDILVLPQKANWKDPHQTLLEDDRVYIMSPGSQKPVKLCLEGSTINITEGQYDNANLTQFSTMKKSWGTGIASNATYGFITVS